MRTLDRKLLRDLRRMWAQVGSIAALMACGAMTIMGLRSTLTSIQRARDEYYASYRFADVFATVERAPLSLGARIALIGGVGAVETRIARDITLHVPGLAEVATAHAVSIPDRQRPMLNALHLRAGRWIAAHRTDEVLVSEHFAELNHIVAGDTLGAVINGRWQRLRVVGVALSPEFVIEVSGNDLFVDNRRSGILWTSRELLETAFDMRGAFNDVVIRLAPGAKERDVVDAVDRLLAPWGGAGAHGRADQPSARVLDDEFTQLRANARIFPTFFLIVGAFLLNTVLSRLITAQRDEIAALKAFGYTNREVGAHYLAFALAAVGLGAILGSVAGIWMGRAFTDLYREYFRFPDLRPVIDVGGALMGIAVSGGFALLGAISAVRRATSLAPADALRPDTPETFRPLLLERLGLRRMTTPVSRMVLRNLERRPLRTLSSVTGIALAVALLAAGRYPYDALDRMMDLQFRSAQRADYTVVFRAPRAARAAEALRQLPDVRTVEPFRATGVRLHSHGVSRTTVITGLAPGSRLRQLVDIDGGVHAVPAAGCVLSASLARALHVRTGDTIAVELLERGSERRPLVIAGVLDETIGQGAFMNLNALHRLLGEGGAISGASLAVDAGSDARVFSALKAMPGVSNALSSRAMISAVNEQTRESVSLVLTIVITSACLIALGVVYNAARIALSERGREFASLRVLGFTRREVSGILLGEQGVTTVLALPLGVLFGLLFSALLARAMVNDRIHFPMVAVPASYVFAAGVVAAAAVLAGLIVRRRIDRLDLVAVLKTRE